MDKLRTIVLLTFILWRSGWLSTAMVDGESHLHASEVCTPIKPVMYHVLPPSSIGVQVSGMEPCPTKSSFVDGTPSSSITITGSGDLTMLWTRAIVLLSLSAWTPTCKVELATGGDSGIGRKLMAPPADLGFEVRCQQVVVAVASAHGGPIVIFVTNTAQQTEQPAHGEPGFTPTSTIAATVLQGGTRIQSNGTHPRVVPSMRLLPWCGWVPRVMLWTPQQQRVLHAVMCVVHPGFPKWTRARRTALPCDYCFDLFSKIGEIRVSHACALRCGVERSLQPQVLTTPSLTGQLLLRYWFDEFAFTRVNGSRLYIRRCHQLYPSNADMFFIRCLSQPTPAFAW